MKRWPPLLLTALLLNASLLATSAPACPGCKDSVASDNAVNGGGDPTMPGGLPGGFNTSIFFMLGGLFGTLGLVGWVVVKGARSTSVKPGGFPVEEQKTPPSDEQESEDDDATKR